MKRAFLAYIPVPHKGYWEVLKQEKGVYLLGSDILQAYPHLKKDIRALSPEVVAEAIKGWGFFVDILSLKTLKALQADTLVLPDEGIMRDLAATHLKGKKIEWVTTFLRRDSDSSTTPFEVHADAEISTKELDKTLMLQALAEGEKSSDWWRRLGALVVREGNIILSAHNHHLPTEYTPFIDGDPRMDFKKGLHIDLTSAQHAEAAVISLAARKGVALEGASMYVSTFPCPTCAKLLVEAGITACYYAEGYGMLDGEKPLRDAGIKIVRVILN